MAGDCVSKHMKAGRSKKAAMKICSLKKGPGPDEAPTLRESMLHKGGVKRSKKVEAGIKKYPGLYKEYKSFPKKKKKKKN